MYTIQKPTQSSMKEAYISAVPSLSFWLYSPSGTCDMSVCGITSQMGPPFLNHHYYQHKQDVPTNTFATLPLCSANQNKQPDAIITQVYKIMSLIYRQRYNV